MKLYGVTLAVILVTAACMIDTSYASQSQSVFRFEQNLKKGERKEAAVSDDPSTCGYKACDLGQADKINVHLVPHTHDDVGWLKTVDQYFYGARNDIQHAGVQYILDTVLEQLDDDPRRRFIYVEVAFFSRWWNELHDSLRHAVKRLVNEGRLEFILGGWCMNDEASTHYNAIIDQHTLGFQFLQRNFGECGRPKIGWQIDPFGHSREQASLFAQFGFDGLFFGRLDYQDKDKRLHDKTMELMWKASASLGDQGALFTGVNFNGYGPPGGFCFDQGCSDAPIMDDERLEDYNVPEVVNAFLKAAKDQARNYTTNHIMMTMGSDFQFENARENYKNLDKLIHYVNDMQKTNGSNVNVFYSTPACYLYALNAANQTYTIKRDDFMPYASRANTFWTGYFSSRPALKRYVRDSNNLLQICKQMDVLSTKTAARPHDLRVGVLREAMGVAQHHDAVSGTEKQAVSDDYARRLSRGRHACQGVIQDAYSRLLTYTYQSPTQEFCPFLNVSFCDPSEKGINFTVTLYNPVARSVPHWVRLPVVITSGELFTVTAAGGVVVSSQVVPVSEVTKSVPDHKGSHSTHDLVFFSSLPPLGYNTYFIQKRSKMSRDKPSCEVTKVVKSPTDDIVMTNEFVSLTVDGSTGLLKTMTNLEKSLTIPLSQTLLYYKSIAGNNSKPQFQSSGAYIFRPNGSDPFSLGNGVKITHNKGDLVEEVEQVFSDWASQVVRLYKGQRHAEIEWTVGPIPYKDEVGKEVISRFSTDLTSNGVFYTDSNGREILRRVRDYRPTWTLNQTEPVAGNYYPVNSRIFIRNEQGSGPQVQLTVLTDRSQGGASIHDGQLELMVHRRMFHDDNYGVGEALNETGLTGTGLVVRGKHYVMLETISDAARHHRDLAQRLFMAPLASMAQSDFAPESYDKLYQSSWSAVNTPLPPNLHLLTLEQWEGTMYLLRLEHFYEANEDKELSQPVKIDLAKIFKGTMYFTAQELVLGANQMLQDAKRLEWNVAGRGRTNGDMSSFYPKIPSGPGQFIVELKPMQIRTFQISLA